MGRTAMDILLVEDNQADARLLMEFLAEKEDSPKVHWVTDGFEALDFVLKRSDHKNAQRPDVILLDLGLPRVDGYDVLKHLKSYPNFASIPVIVLTTSRNPLDRTQCSALGADGFISKPRDLQGFEDLAKQLLEDDLPKFLYAANCNGEMG